MSRPNAKTVRGASLRTILFAIAILAGAGLDGPLRAEFSPAVPITETGGGATDVALALDPANNVVLATVAGQHIQVDIIGPNLRVTREIGDASGPRSEPDLATNSLGVSFLVFVERSAAGSRHDVWLVSNRGGQFRAPVNVSLDPSRDDRRPCVTTDNLGEPRIVWESTGIAASDVRVMYRGADQTAREIARGARPALHVDLQNRAHVIYLRDDTIWYRHETVGGSGEFVDEMQVARLSSTRDAILQLTIDEGGAIFVLYANAGTLFFTSKPGGGSAPGFSPPRVVDSGNITHAKLRVRRGGVLSFVYEKAGDLWMVQGVADFLLPPDFVFGEETSGREERPAIVIDTDANLHVAFVLDGEAHYTNNATEVVADFTANPPTGEGPLTVNFRDLSNGKVQRWLWDFGDGAQSSESNPTHMYGLPGKYTVTLTVYNADRVSVEKKEDFITVQESSNTMEIPRQAVYPGQEDVWFPVLASHDEPIQSFQIHAEWDPTILTLTECTDEFTAVRALDPDIFYTNIGERNVEIGVLFELSPPYIHPELSPGTKRPIMQLRFDVSNEAPVGSVSEVKLVNDASRSAIFNIFTVHGFSVLPVIKPGRVEVVDRESVSAFFLRGDADASGSVDISDAIRILGYLFLGGAKPVCMDAADVRDEGRVDISAPITLLNFLFLGGQPPSVPFPKPGIDPTTDALDCEVGV
ncbi:MAG TPA: PKD domain-containing protein [Planctomycetota bacterium]|nr:PKD domain-containing protein [Planctomycetota bacterium]